MNPGPNHTAPDQNQTGSGNTTRPDVRTNPELAKSLFLRISEGDEQAFESLFHTYNRHLHGFVLSLTKNEADAKEVIQEIFLKVWLKRETLTAIDNPGAWLHTVAANSAYEHLRKEARYASRLKKFASITPGLFDSSTASGGAASSDPNLSDIHNAFDSREIQSLIAEAVEKLPARRRQVFKMARFEGYSRKEIAQTLGISENTVRNQITEASVFVQDYLRKNGPLYLPLILIAGLF